MSHFVWKAAAGAALACTAVLLLDRWAAREVFGAVRQIR